LFTLISSKNLHALFHHAGVVSSVAGGGRVTVIMACQNQFAAGTHRSIITGITGTVRMHF